MTFSFLKKIKRKEIRKLLKIKKKKIQTRLAIRTPTIPAGTSQAAKWSIVPVTKLRLVNVLNTPLKNPGGGPDFVPGLTLSIKLKKK